MSTIKRVLGREVLDSRGNPTVEVEIITKDCKVRAIVPSGASTGSYEAVELRDGKIDRYHGKGVQKAIANVNLLGRKLVGKRLDAVDPFLLKSDNESKSKYGANAILGISLAATKAQACSEGKHLYQVFGKLAHNHKFKMPTPLFNVINGGMHAGNRLDFQEYLVIPKAKSFREELRIGSEIHHELKQILMKKYGKTAVNVGDEGGFAPPLEIVEDPLDFILDAAKELGYEKNITLGIDCASTRLKVNREYVVERKSHTAFEMIDIYKQMAKMYPISYLEDPFAEDDWQNFYILTKELGKKVHIVGDDLLVTNPKRIQQAIELRSCNALLLKMNQIGTISETIQAAHLAQKAKWNVIVSHRSGETEDTSIADLSVGIGASHIKAGAPCRGERTAKYNQLLRIEEQLK